MKHLKEFGEMLLTLIAIVVGFLVIGTAFTFLYAMVSAMFDLF